MVYAFFCQRPTAHNCMVVSIHFTQMVSGFHTLRKWDATDFPFQFVFESIQTEGIKV
uniref:Uncharacterized protein n=1 Tax=Anguilla anguilla TaxID=7936 RepID=A0A0E9VGD6_ANGAN